MKKYIDKIEKYGLYIGLISFCLLLSFLIDSVPYLNLQKEVVLTFIYLFVVTYIAVKLNFSMVKLLVILAALTIAFSFLSLTAFAESIANVFYLVMVIQVLRMLRSSTHEN